VNLLLDTHTFIWLVDGGTQLSPAAKAAVVDPQNTLVLSVASIWEMAIKTCLPKNPLVLSDPLETYLAKWVPAYQVRVLPVETHHALGVPHLPVHHRDPFDRIMIAQAITEGMSLVTADAKFTGYPVPVIW